MFVPVESTSAPVHPQMPSAKEITIVCLLFAAVVIFQIYVYLKLEDPQDSIEQIDKERREEERRRRNDLLMKALSAF
ncbi:hypothetical protein RB195_025761 [Necator americanus]|uniref:Uncharacterized protein n=2 Tax=Necator americanus TaxID=51031 RepID=A0ABR1ETR9_NECAM|nr:hypothetical protein NECAME_00007 [Necator americanus]ETN87148.1 hypothetical protein NECAME_00007 [Necator americanus]